MVERGRYSVSYEDGVGNDFVLWQPAFGPFHRQQWLNVAGDTLWLRDATARGHVGMWVRSGTDPHWSFQSASPLRRSKAAPGDRFR